MAQRLAFSERKSALIGPPKPLYADLLLGVNKLTYLLKYMINRLSINQGPRLKVPSHFDFSLFQSSFQENDCTNLESHFVFPILLLINKQAFKTCQNQVSLPFNFGKKEKKNGKSHIFISVHHDA
jgi:hypothetical protein